MATPLLRFGGWFWVRSLKVSEQILNFMYNWIGSEWSLLIVSSLGDFQSWKAGLATMFQTRWSLLSLNYEMWKVVSYNSPGTRAAAIDITMSSVEDCFMCLKVLKWKMQSWHGGVCRNSSLLLGLDRILDTWQSSAITEYKDGRVWPSIDK